MATKERNAKSSRASLLKVSTAIFCACLGLALMLPLTLQTAAAQGADGGGPAASILDSGAQSAALAQAAWQPSATAGFLAGNGNFMANPLAAYGGELYVGVSNGAGCEVRVLRGGAWQVVNTPGFGDPDNDAVLSLQAYGGRLYAGTFNFTAGCEVWSYDGASWRQEVGQDPAGTPGTGNGFGNLNNCAAYSMQVHDGKLYVGTVDIYVGMLPPFVGSNGGDIWCCDGAAWSQSMDGGFGDIRNMGVMSLEEYGGDLYAGTMCAEISVDAASLPVVDITFAGKGCQLWSEGTGSWTQVAGGGFGDADNAAVMSMEVYLGELFLGTFNGGLTFSLDISTMSFTGLGWHSNGLGVYSFDGASLSGVVEGGFPGIGGIGIFSMLAVEVGGEDLLLAGAARKIEEPGQEIDVNSLLMVYDGQSWGRAAADGFGNPNNMINVSLAEWGGTAYVGTVNAEDGCEIWRGVPSPPPPQAPAFYFAEGYTGPGFQEYLCLGQPADAPLGVTVTFLFKGGREPLVRDYDVPPLSRLTVNVNEVVGADQEVSIRCESADPFISERPMYFDYTGAGEHWTGGHDAVGASAPAYTWYFAEGYIGAGFDEWVCVLNPGDAPADLTFRFQTQEEGEIVVADRSVPANSRETFKVNQLLGGKSFQTSLKLESSRPVVAERPMYFDYLGAGVPLHWTGGHCVMGVTGLATEYYFAEGTTRTGFEEYLTLQNPGAADISVHAVYMLETGETVEEDYPVPASRRATVFVPEEVGAGRDVSVHLTCGEPFLAERPMYFDYTGIGAAGWTGGHCVIGSTVTAATWFFAEGYTGDGFEEWLCIQNPGASAAHVTITYYPEGGGVPIVREQPEIAANSRYTVYVNYNAAEDLSLSAEVTSDRPVIVERPMYFDFGGWTGGHDVVGYAP